MISTYSKFTNYKNWIFSSINHRFFLLEYTKNEKGGEFYLKKIIIPILTFFVIIAFIVMFSLRDKETDLTYDKGGRGYT